MKLLCGFTVLLIFMEVMFLRIVFWGMPWREMVVNFWPAFLSMLAPVAVLVLSARGR